MKKQFTLLLVMALVFCSCHIFAQKKLVTPDHLKIAKPMPAAKTGFERPAVDAIGVPLSNTALRTAEEFPIGGSVYDLQTNGSMQNRCVNIDGVISSTWTMGFDSDNGYPNRGTGYNTGSGVDWGAPPFDRLEDDIRTGWPSLTILGNGNKVVMNHFFATPYKVNILTQTAGSEDWVQTELPSNVPDGVLWPKSCVGGEDNMTIHALAITTPTGLQGAVYEGIDGHVLYYRSTDGGSNWDKVDFVVPGMGNDSYCSGRADGYVIESRGNTVVIAMLPPFGDAKILRSDDNGDTWTSTTIMEFPIDNYCIDDLYTYDDLPEDPDAPDSLAVAGLDSSGAIAIDNDGNIHFTAGQMYYQDDAVDAAGWTYYPFTSGLVYWNESMGENNTMFLTDVIDANGNDTLDITDAGQYAGGLTSYPSMGVDPANGIHLAYSGCTENFFDENNDQQMYRHIYVMSSLDGGNSWSEPFDLINPDIIDPDVYEFVEGAFPAVANDVDEHVHIVYQQDFRPGLSVVGDTDIAGQATFQYICYDTPMLSSNDEADAIIMDARLIPNPAKSATNVAFELAQADNVNINVYNVTGALLLSQQKGNTAAGQHYENIDLANYGQGVYFVELAIGNVNKTLKLVIQ